MRNASRPPWRVTLVTQTILARPAPPAPRTPTAQRGARASMVLVLIGRGLRRKRGAANGTEQP